MFIKWKLLSYKISKYITSIQMFKLLFTSSSIQGLYARGYNFTQYQILESKVLKHSVVGKTNKWNLDSSEMEKNKEILIT